MLHLLLLLVCLLRHLAAALAVSPTRWSLHLCLRIEKACLDTIAEGKYLTRDLGGKSGTTDFTKAIIGALDD
jgi:isocitrate/isopropylmalate dehydrogenase